MESEQELRSLKRGLRALEILNQVEALGVSELARRLDLPRTTAERIIATLATEGYVHRLQGDKRYRLSARVCNLSSGFSDVSWIINVATPLLFDTTRQIGWPLAIATPQGENMAVRMTTDAATSLWLHRRRVGAEIAMLNSSSGLLWFSLSPPSERRRLMALFADSAGVNRALAARPRLIEEVIAPIERDRYAFQPPPGDRPEGSVSLPIVVDGAMTAVLLMMYMPRALKSETVLETFLPLLQRLASTIGERAGRHEDETSLARPPLNLPGVDAAT